MEEQLSALPPVPREAAQSYAAQAHSLVDRVNRAMAATARRERLLGGVPIKVMADNHRNHAAFMANVFLLGRYRLLAKIVPWVYRAYGNQGFQPGYFPTAFQAWIDAVEALLPAEHAASIRPVYEWLLQVHPEVLEMAGEPLVPATPLDPAWARQRAAFLEALVTGDSKRAQKLALAIPSDPHSLCAFFRQVVQPAMYEVGNRWEQGEMSVAREHLASAIVARVMSAHHARMPAPGEPHGLAVVATVSNEFHELGAWMVATALELEGWQVHYLGANTPEESLVDLIRETSPQMVALSVAMPFNLDNTARLIRRIRGDRELEGTRIMVGGLVFHYMPELVENLGADAWAADCESAARQAEAWR